MKEDFADNYSTRKWLESLASLRGIREWRKSEHKTLKIISLIVYGSVICSAFYLACRYEQTISGDTEWAIFYLTLFGCTVAAYLATRLKRMVFLIGSLSPLAYPGMFLLVSIVFSACIALAGVSLGQFIVQSRNERPNQPVRDNA